MTATSLLSILGGLVLLSGCLSNTPTKTLTGTANDPVAAAQRAALGLGDMAEENADSLPDLTATSFTGVGSGLTLLNATQLTSGTLPDARFPATLPALNGSALTALNATQLTSGTVPDARFPATLPALNGSALTALNATQLTSGTVPDARFPATLPALNGSALTALNATQLTSGTVPDARFPATLPALNGSALTALSADNISSGTLAISRGGTGATTAAAARTALEVTGSASPTFTGYLSTTCVAINMDDDSGTPNPVLGDVAGERHSCVLLQPDVADADGDVTITLATTGATAGSRLTLVVTAGIMRLNDAGTATLSANWAADAGDTLQLIFDGTNWAELSRSAN